MPDQFEIPEDVTVEEMAGALFRRPVKKEGRKMVRLEIAEPDVTDPDWTPLRRVYGIHRDEVEDMDG